MDYKYRGTFIISGENTRILPGKGYEVYHCDRVRSLLDDINKKGKSMYAKIQEIQFPETLDYSVRITEYNCLLPGDAQDPSEDVQARNDITHAVTTAIELPPPEPRPAFLHDYVVHWSDLLAQKFNSAVKSTDTLMECEMSSDSKRLYWFYMNEHSDGDFIMPQHQYHIEFGTGLQIQFGLPPVVGRNADPMWAEYPITYRAQKEGETNAQYTAYKTKADAEWKEHVKLLRDKNSRIEAPNVNLLVNSKPIDCDTNPGSSGVKYDCWEFNASLPNRYLGYTAEPHYVYFSHADLCGNSLNLQRATCLVDYPYGTVYDARDEYLYVHNCSPFPAITFTTYEPYVNSRGTIEYEKHLVYPMQFYVIIDYYEA